MPTTSNIQLQLKKLFKKSQSPPEQMNHNWFTTPYYIAVEKRPWLSIPQHKDAPPLGDTYENIAERVRYTKAVDLEFEWKRSEPGKEGMEVEREQMEIQRKERGIVEEDFKNGWGLPVDILEEIGKHLGLVDLMCLRSVNRRMRYEVIGCQYGELDRDMFNRRGMCRYFDWEGWGAKMRMGKLNVRMRTLSPCMWLNLWQRLERDIGVDKAERLSCWYCVKQHPRKDFEWESKLHGYGKDLVKSEERICWAGYQGLIGQIGCHKFGGYHNIPIVEVTGVGRVAAIEVNENWGNDVGADLIPYVEDICSTCFGKQSCRFSHDIPIRDICCSCSKVRRIPIMVIKGLATLRSRLRECGTFHSKGTWILSRRGKRWAAKQGMNDVRNTLRKRPHPIRRQFRVLEWHKKRVGYLHFPGWWKLSFKQDLENDSSSPNQPENTGTTSCIVSFFGELGRSSARTFGTLELTSTLPASRQRRRQEGTRGHDVEGSNRTCRT